MSKRRKRLRKTESTERSVLNVKYILVSIISTLLAVAAVLVFKVGESLWPAWLHDHQMVFIVIPLFIVVFLIVLSPIILLFTKDPRHIAGTSKRPSWY